MLIKKFILLFISSPKQAIYRTIRYAFWKLPPGLRSKLLKLRFLFVHRSLSSWPKFDKRVAEELQALTLNTQSTLPTIVFRPLVDWWIPLFQRPQHVALNLARAGHTYFYCVPELKESNKGTYLKLQDSLYLTKHYLSALSASNAVLHVYAGDMRLTIKDLLEAKENNVRILYEYIDEIHSDLSGIKIPPEVLQRHEYAKSDQDIIVVCSAQKLLEEVQAVRKKNVLLVTNGVEIEHFSELQRKPIAPDFDSFVSGESPVIGYFGAFAKWFDYELIVHLAQARPNYKIVLIGWDYDGSITGHKLQQYSNIMVLGPIDYPNLPKYAAWFDVSTIPFVVNAITESTSPVKMFEYMAMGKPIVATAMRECKRYASVLIANSSADFVSKIDLALTKREDHEYLDLLKSEAQANSWISKASNISKLLLSETSRYESDRLTDVQNEIENCMQVDFGLQNYYTKAYRATEIYYWFPVLKWIEGLSDVDSVIDIGTAYGTLLAYAAKVHQAKTLEAVDPCNYMAPSIVEKFKINKLTADFERQSCEFSRKFDLVIFTEVLEHLNFHPVPTLIKLKQLIAEGGHLIVSTPDSDEWGQVTQYYQNLQDIPEFSGQTDEWIDGHVWQYSRSEAETVFELAGLKVVDWQYSKGVNARHLCYLLVAA
jgi:teichuronic acid biosynthesis glycosyltransferase TuaH